MFLEMKEHTERKGNGRLVVGYDLGNENSQISYCYLNSDTPETLSGVAGGESYHIPTALCRKKGVNQWFYGKEAVRYAKEEGGILIRRLPDLAKEGEKVTVEEDEVDPVALLSLFMKRSLNMLSVIEPADKIEAIMVTCEDMDQNMTEVLNQAVAGMGLKTKRVIFQNYMESFYAYVLHQPEELWKQQVLLCDYHEDYLKIYRMECNRHTTPVVAFVEKMHFPAMVMRKLPEGDFARARSERQLMIQEMDRQFLTIMEQVCGSRFISSVYLIGTGFSEEWMKDSLKFLCKGRRVFQGNNLYSKGSCYSIKEQIVPTELSSGFVFLGEEKLKSNIGMKVFAKEWIRIWPC